jgi:tetratricopeptide (TPR) repeat protein
MAARGQPEVSDRILLTSIEAQPHERQYQRQRTFEYLGRALNEISRGPVTEENLSGIRRELDVAERQARAALARYPGDPWLILALANVLQIRGLAALRPIAPDEGLAAAQEADRLFASAYEIFPNQPLLLRNWAQLRFNEGDFWGAFRLIDRMEEVIPAELEPYAERVILAKRINELDVVRETLARAESRLDPLRMEQLRTVAGLQQ